MSVLNKLFASKPSVKPRPILDKNSKLALSLTPLASVLGLTFYGTVSAIIWPVAVVGIIYMLKDKMPEIKIPEITIRKKEKGKFVKKPIMSSLS